jgi:hypothetical protein
MMEISSGSKRHLKSSWISKSWQQIPVFFLGVVVIFSLDNLV